MSASLRSGGKLLFIAGPITFNIAAGQIPEHAADAIKRARKPGLVLA
jgi:hypothetical protein